MKTSDILKHLRNERSLLDVAITRLAILERAQLAMPGTDLVSAMTAGRRGRKSMGQAERLEVSARMKRYWAGRRKARTA